MGLDRQRALRELLVRAWCPLLERTRGIDAGHIDRGTHGWRRQRTSREVTPATAGDPVAERESICFSGP